MDDKDRDEGTEADAPPSGDDREPPPPFEPDYEIITDRVRGQTPPGERKPETRERDMKSR